ncbi:MAG: TatD family hydrolase [Candidatus Doudnabacteria bacterium]|nr:TatD family hydrolase [Candidatus Doudnabacteria bacterium]
MLVDTHAHVNFKAFSEDATEVITRALDEHVWVINVGTQIDTSRQAVELVDRCQRLIVNCQLFAVIGLHPVHTYSQHLDEEETSFLSREEKFDYNAYRELAKSPKVMGIGECGLDYYRLPNNDDRASVIEKQKTVFIAQIKLAKELNKALVIHCRPSAGTQDAYEDILKILDSELQLSPPNIGGVPAKGGGGGIRFEIHSFTGSPEIAQEFLKRGAYVGLNGIITFDKTGNMAKVVEALPLDRIVLETDSPYLTPVPYRGKRNEPAYVKFVAEKVAKITGLAYELVEKVTTENAKTLFKI